MSKVLKIIVNSILVIIIILLGIYAFLRIINKVDIYKVQTGSMEDGIHAGDYILIIKQDNYKIDDVVTYKKDGYNITHRIVKESGDKVITKGDANNTEDEEISKDSIIGKVYFKGGILNFVVNFKYALVSLFLGVYLLTYYFDKSNKEKEEEKIKEQKE